MASLSPSVDRNVLVARNENTIRAMLIDENERSLLISGDDLRLREFRLPECQETDVGYGKDESHLGAGTEHQR